MNRQHRLLTLMFALLILAIPAMNCGMRTIVEAIPTATLVGDAPAFSVAAFTADQVQMLAGKTGRLLWKRQFPPDAMAVGLTVSGVLYRSAQTDPLVTAMRPDDGTILWQFRGCPSADGPATIQGGMVYVTCDNDLTSADEIVASDTLYALDAQTGRVRWRLSAHHFRAIFGSVVITQSSDGVQAIQADSGKPLWSHTTVILAHSRQATSVRRFFNFVVQMNPDIVAYSPDGAHVEALRASNGQLLWRSNAIPHPGPVDTADWSVLAVTPSVVVAHGFHGVAVFDTTTGSIRWQRIDQTTAAYLGSAVNDDGSIVYAGQPTKNLGPFGQQLCAFDAASGSVLWKSNQYLDWAIDYRDTLWMDGSTIYVNELTALRAKDGVVRWNDVFAAPVRTPSLSPWVIGVGAGAYAYLLNARDGKKVWKTQVDAREGRSRTQALLIFWDERLTCVSG